MASAEFWADFDAIRHNIKLNTVDKLKQILTGLNDECGTHHARSGKKQDLIDRVNSSLDQWHITKAEDKWSKAKAVIAQVRSTGAYSSQSHSIASSSTSASNPPMQSLYHANNLVKSSYQTSTSGTSALPRYDPYAPPRRPVVPPAASTSSPAFQKPTAAIRFKESPFFHIEQILSNIVECPESASSTDRRQQHLNFTLSVEQINKIRAPGSKYQLRLFCTSSFFYSGHSTFRATSSNSVPCLVEFPPTCEVRVNNVQLNANLKGLKKKPGTAPPPDITKLARLTATPNRVELVYVNSQQPVQNKKYYMAMMLVEYTGVEELVEKLGSSYWKSEDIKRTMAESANLDDDIVAGPSKMSLKCPLSFMRVVTPCRSSKCVHSQCFDATSWYYMMEQTTTWLCPVCEKQLDHRELIIDGYFDEILKTVPESIEDVIVEADGEWHTADNKYGSGAWRAKNPVVVPAQMPKKEESSPSIKLEPEVSVNKLNGLQKTDVSYILLSDDDEDEVQKELSPSRSANRSINSTPQRPSQKKVLNVIDLTLDSDEDEPAPVQPGKRKIIETELGPTSPTEPIWKKGRHEFDYQLPSIATLHNSSSSPHFRQSTMTSGGRLPPPHPINPGSPTRFSHYPGTSTPLYNNLSIRGNGPTPGPLQLPPLSGLPPHHQSGQPRWP